MDGNRTGTLRSLALVATLLLVAVAPAATADYHQSDPGADTEGPPDYAQAWKDIKAHLGDGNVSQARTVYTDTFAAGADTAPGARGAILAGFADAANASGTDDLAYVAAKQAIDKSLYAVAFANVEAAVAAEDVASATAWFGLLSAKFGDALAGADAAFANATAEELPDAFTTLEAEFRDVITGKVYKETTEAPELLAAGDQATAVKEAAEGRYYYLGIQDHVREVLGADGEAHLADELDGLLQATREGAVEEAEGEASEVLAAVAHYALKGFDNEKGDAFTTYKGHVGDENLTAARAVYNAEFAEDAEEYAPAAHARVLGAFTNATAALEAGDGVEYDIQGQILKKSVLDIATRVAIHELEEGEVDEGAEWFRVLAVKFGWDDDPSDAYLAVGRMVASGQFDEGYFDAAREGLYGTFLDKVYEEVDETLFDVNWGTPTAREKAIEGVLYYQPLKPDVAATLNATVADHIDHELEELYAAATAVDREEAEHVAEETRALLGDYEASKTDATGLDAAVANMQRTLRLIKMEIGEYFDYLEAGNTEKAQEEVEESKSFLTRVESAFAENKAAFQAADAEATETVSSNIEEIGIILATEERLDDVPAIVDATNEALESFKGAGGGLEPTVTIAFGAPEAGDERGTIRVPVRLVGVAENGYAFQAEVYYDAAVLNVTGVDVSAPVGDSLLEEGEFTFNAADTSAPGGEAEVAVITFKVLDAAAGATDLEVEVQELTDASGKPLGVKEVTGASLNPASANVDDAGNTTPAAGLSGLLAAVAVALATGAALLRVTGGRKQE